MNLHRFFPLVSWLVLAATGAEASQVRPLNLEELTRRAERVFAGRCIEVERGRSEAAGLPIERVTFAVETSIKGGESPTVTFEILAAEALPFAGLPRFAAGERVLLFLYSPSQLGLTSPVGLGQGKFSVVRDKHGLDTAVNALGHEPLSRGLSAEARAVLGSSLEPGGSGNLSLESVLDSTRKLIALDAVRGEARP